MIVADGSVVVEVVITDVGAHRAVAAMRGRSTLAPDILDAEVMHALKGLEREGFVSARRAERAVELLVTAPIVRISSQSLARRAWALRHNLPLYDALYVALAQQQDVPLLTADRGMAEAAAKAEVTVTLV